MSPTRTTILALLGLLAVHGVTLAGQFEAIYPDPVGDAVIRPTDRGGDGGIHPDAVLPDIVSVSVAGWLPFNPSVDPYGGLTVISEGADIFRLQVVLDGLVNPPGTLGLSGQPFDPYRFGNSPVFGFIEIDVDDRKDTGGHLGTSAESRFMANVARFGTRPEGSIGERAARSAAEYDQSLFTGAPYERSGADWSLSLCGCSSVTLVSEQGNGNGVFEAGEIMIVRGRFFARSEGYNGPSGMSGGSVPGAYDPWVNVRFRHIVASNQTEVTYVGPLTQTGWSLLAGDPFVYPLDFRANNAWSITEGVSDLLVSATRGSGQAAVLIEDWEGRDIEDSLEPVEWSVTALLGTSYTSQFVDGLFVWTDVGFFLETGDFDGDSFAGPLDQAELRNWVYDNDGGSLDGDGVKNGVVLVDDAPYDFSIFDIDADGRVRHEDLAAYGPRADLDGDGSLTVFDFLTFQNYFDAADLRADFDLNETLNIFDFLAFQNAFDE